MTIFCKFELDPECNLFHKFKNRNQDPIWTDLMENLCVILLLN